MTGRFYTYVAVTAAGIVCLVDARSACAEPQEPQSTCQTSIMSADDGAPSDYFGWSAAIGVDYVFLGAKAGDKGDEVLNAGSVYIFQRDGIEWIQQGELNASDATTNDEFGTSVSVSGDLLVVFSYYFTFIDILKIKNSSILV